MSWLTTEQWVWNDKRHLSPHKIPATSDLSEHLEIDLWPEPDREANVFGSKGHGRTPLMLAISVLRRSRMRLPRPARSKLSVRSRPRHPRTCWGY